MNYPTHASVVIRTTFDIEISDFEKEYFQREGFSEEDVYNTIESRLRDSIVGKYINDNDIKIILS